MSSTPRNLIDYLRDISNTWRNDSRSDAELMARFAEMRDQTAFKVLVGRHGPMVWQTCQRILGDTPDTEDVFQSTFLALTRKAGLFPVKSLAGWLHRVARRAALDVSANIRRRRSIERPINTEAQLETKNDASRDEWHGALDEELAGLSEKLRVPLVLHFLEGKTQEEVARILGSSQSAVQRRLVQGEASLRKRLEQRGMTLGIGVIATLLGNTAKAPAMPNRLIESTAQAAVAFRSGALAGTSAEAAEKLLRSLSLKGTVWNGWWMVLVGICAFGIVEAGLAAWKAFTSSSDSANVPVEPAIASKQSDTVQNTRNWNPRVDIYGDPLPRDAVARIGTTRFRGPGTDREPMENDKVRFNVTLSPDGKTLVSAHAGGIWGGEDEHKVTIRFWDANTGKHLHETLLEGDCVNTQIAFSPDGKKLMIKTLGSKENIQFLDTVTGQPTGQSFLGSWPVVFTHDSKTLVSRDSTRSDTELDFFTFQDIDTKALINTLKVKRVYKESDVTFAVFSRDSQCFACLEETEKKSAVHLLDVKTGKELTTLKGQQVAKLVFAPNGNLVTAGKDKVIRIWNVGTGKQIHQLSTMAEVPSLVGFLADGRTIIAACPGQICFWDVTTGRETRPTLNCKGLLCPQILSADGTKLVERFRDTLGVWDVATGKEIDPAAGASRSIMDQIVFSPDGEKLATAGAGVSKIQLWKVTSGKQIGSLATPVSASAFWELAWPSHNMLMARALPNIVPVSTIFQLTTTAEGQLPVGMQVYSNGVKFSPDGQVLACWQGKNFEIFEVATGKKLSVIPCHVNHLVELVAINTLVFSADHQTLAVHYFDEPTVTLWDVSTGRKLYSFNLPEPALDRPNDEYDQLIGFSPDARLVVTENRCTRNISLWEHISGRLRLRLPAPFGSVYAENNVVFSRDGRLLSAGYIIGPKEERSVHIWDLASGKESQQFQGHKSGVSWAGAPRVMFSPDGRCLASSGMDYTVLIWNVKQPPALEKSTKPLDQKEMQALKTALVGANAMAAHQAIWKLQQVPEQAIPLVNECLRQLQTSTVTAREVSRLIGELDSDNFQTRVKAAEKLGKKLREEENEPIVENILFRTLAEKTSIEVNKAVLRLLDDLKEERKWGGALSPELTRMVRAIEVLELIHNDTADKILQKMVESPPRPEVGKEAAAALKRLAVLSFVPHP